MKPRLTVVGRVINTPQLEKSQNTGTNYLVLDLKCTWTEIKQNERMNLYSTYRINLLGQKALDASGDIVQGDVVEIQCSLQSQEKNHNNQNYINLSIIGFDYEKLNRPINGNSPTPPQPAYTQKREQPPQQKPQANNYPPNPSPSYYDQNYDEPPF
jgi:single-stranded DNA-binding protein